MKVVGNYLSDLEIKEVVSSFKGKKKYNNLIEELKQFEGLDIDQYKFKVVQGLKFDVQYGIDVISVTSVQLKVTDSVEIMYVSRYRNANKKTMDEFFHVTYSYSEEDNHVKRIHLYAGNDRYISTSNSTVEKEKIEQEEKFDQEDEIPIDENYYPGMLLDQVSTRGIFDFCLPGGYKYCGKSCGGKKACNANSPNGINGLDNCCKTHDCCYHQRGVSWPNPICDKIVCDCALKAPFKKNTTVVTAVMCYTNIPIV